MNELILKRITKETSFPLWIYYMENVPYESIVRVSENKNEFLINSNFYKATSRCF